MSKKIQKTYNYTCDNCDVEYTIKTPEEDIPGVCPFCGELIEDLEHDEEIDDED